ncbi:C40 family peptidase [Phytomonospora endophytica]|uniref:Cell wall-associated NlpC family hydrolase n=1 Tax=Phytomonospora endophytica TaxID=714109 RepID=A0A841FYE4_9ACTN|nr:C40 family peptidase [Phytomonospora endophytica]MBB6037469.1 cell wall-associated NlpC family hydrolase [Phytomonospora endophytica]GIG70719.1 hypothetical protein Pen01_70140 [Phytomonospora endophytica]
MRPLWTKARKLGRVLFMFTTAAVMLAAMPATVALADPPGVTAPPAGGSRPDGSVPPPTSGLPGTGTGLPPTGTAVPGIGPLASQIQTKNVELAKLAEQSKAATIDLGNRNQLVTASLGQLNQAQSVVDALETAVSDLAAKKYTDSGATPLDLSGLAPGSGDSGDDLTAQLADARTTLDEAQAAYDAATAAQTRATERDSTLRTAYEKLNTEVTKLVKDNQKAILDAEKAREEFSKGYSGKFGEKVKGYSAGPKAIKAAQWALKQLGKPYQWSEEGPNSFDCSGLMWAAYRSVGISLPRIANDQYHQTSDEPIGVEYLLPGDLIFYGDRPGDWTSVYHVGMYIGDGKMVQAPTAGDVVKVSPVWFDDYFGATRVVKAVKGDGDDVTPPPTTGNPSPSPSPSSPSPSPSSPSPSPSGSSMFPSPSGSGSDPDSSSSPSPSDSGSESAGSPSGIEPSPDPLDSGAASSVSPSA